MSDPDLPALSSASRRPDGRCRRGRLRSALAVLVAALAAFVVVLGAAALNLPVLGGRVVDEAGVLDGGTKAVLERKLADFEARTSDQLVVVTLKSLQGATIEDFGVELGRRWRIGQKDKNNGVLLIVAPNERKVRIEVGYGLEGALPDAVAKLIIDTSIIPRFRSGDISGGVSRGVEDIIAALTTDAEAWKQRAAQSRDTAPGAQDAGVFILVLVVFVVVILFVSRGGGRGGRWATGAFLSASSSWSSGSSGGFSGGGGSFGGGGSSGSW